MLMLIVLLNIVSSVTLSLLTIEVVQSLGFNTAHTQIVNSDCLNPLVIFRSPSLNLQLVDLSASKTSEHLLGQGVASRLTIASVLVFPGLDGSERSYSRK
jgi:hypothetical protein